MYLHLLTSSARRFFFCQIAIFICLLSAPTAHSQDNSSQSPAHEILLITPSIRENPSILKIKPPDAADVSRATFSLYTLNGRKILEKALDKSMAGRVISGDEIFGERIALTAGYYIYQIRDSEPLPFPFTAPGQLYFNDVSQTHLPGDSTPVAYTDFVDVTGDSFPDIVLGLNSFITLEQPQIYINDGSGNFANETAARFPSLQLLVNDVTVFDADSDGDPDIYFVGDDFSGGSLNTDRLLLNDGQGFFSDASFTHLPQTPALYQNADWGLINDDPYPDLLLTSTVIFVGIFPPETQLTILLNDGAGHFNEDNSALPQTQYNVFDAVLTDVDKDSLADIVLACLGDIIFTDDEGNPIDTLSGRNAVFIRNNNGTFSDETATRMPDIVRWSRSMKIADINNDGAVDLYSVNIGFSASIGLNTLYVNNGNGFFSDETANRLPLETITWNNDAEFGDFDRNGFADLFIINVLPGGSAPDFLYFNNNGFFSDESAHLPPIIDFNVSTAVADMERDGDADIFISVAPGSLGIGIPTGLPDLLYQNVLPPSGVGREPGLQPGQFVLFQNYPNPFNPETAISFQLSALSYVELEIFDVSGRRVATLVSKQLPPGEYEVNWDGRDDAGRAVGSGVYVYRLKAGKFVQSRKMLLVH